ncbi:MAG: hypothetical protein PHI63_05500 [Patescibacteria group bacterium]|nr:hypothetical protein [Patescibacteria group bacterium]
MVVLAAMTLAWTVGPRPSPAADTGGSLCPLYTTDFTTDPHWTTDQPSNYFWDSTAKAFSAKVLNAGVWPSRFAYTQVDFGGGSVELEFNLKFANLDLSSALSFGLFNSDRSVHNTDRPSARGFFFKFGRNDQGKAIQLVVIGGSEVERVATLFDGITPGTWYHVVLEYESTVDQATCLVTNRDTAAVIANLQLGNIGGLPADLDFLGFARDPMGSCCPNNCGTGYTCSASASGLIDDIILSTPCTGQPTLSLSTARSSPCSPGRVSVLLTSSDAVTAFSYGISHDPAVLSVGDIAFGSVVQAVNGGQGPEFWSVSKTPVTADCQGVNAGVTVAMVVSTSGDPQAKAIPSGSAQEITVIQYSALGSAGTESALDFCDCLRPKANTEQVACVVVSNGSGLTPIKKSGKVTVDSKCFFMRGDCNDDGNFNIADAVTTLTFLFVAGKTVPCQEACNANDDSSLDISDALRMLFRLFTGDNPIPPPFNACGTDPTPSLSCSTYTNC